MKKGEDLGVEVTNGVTANERVEEERRGGSIVVENEGGRTEVAGTGVHGDNASGKGGVDVDAMEEE